MSRVSFERLANENPRYKRVLDELASWIDNHPQDYVLNPLRLRRDIRKVTAEDLTIALTLLVKAGFLRRVYKVLTPSGVFAEPDFDDPSVIPPKLPDRFERYFDTAEADVVPIFRLVA
jgi:hypothetical protein